MNIKDNIMVILYAVLIAAIITALSEFSMNKSYKKGYEEAVKDFNVGKLKCDYIDGKIIWKE